MKAPYASPPEWGNHVLKLWPSYYPGVDEQRTDAIDVPDDGWAPQLRIGGFTALLTIAAGFAVLAGWVWLGGLGIVLGLVVDVIGLVWLRRRYGAVVPRHVPGRALLQLLVAAVVLGGIAFLANGG
jgi:hypothetical protein